MTASPVEAIIIRVLVDLEPVARDRWLMTSGHYSRPFALATAVFQRFLGSWGVGIGRSHCDQQAVLLVFISWRASASKSGLLRVALLRWKGNCPGRTARVVHWLSRKSLSLTEIALESGFSSSRGA
jgi:hypothetical protein